MSTTFTTATTRPPYVVPGMAEIAAVEQTGLVAVSTFSGCGGSSTGYRMAGFRVAWASEFVAAAADTYRANADPQTVLDTRDIREVQPGDVLEVAGDVDLLDGSPPCSPFSTQGVTSRDWGEAVPYSSTSQRTDDLFWEFARLVEGVQPKAFIGENVYGLVRGVAKGYFKRILARLRSAGYRVEARLLDASWLGAPQERKRLIFAGVRDDLALAPALPAPLAYRRTIGDALGAGYGGVYWRWGVADMTRPCPTIQTTFTSHSRLAVLAPPGTDRDPETGRDLHDDYDLVMFGGRDRAALGLPAPYAYDVRRPTLAELRALAGFPPDFKLTGSYNQRWERIGRAVPPVMMANIAAAVRDRVLLPAREAA